MTPDCEGISMENGKQKRGKVSYRRVFSEKETDNFLVEFDNRLTHIESLIDWWMYFLLGYLIYYAIHGIIFRGKEQ